MAQSHPGLRAQVGRGTRSVMIDEALDHDMALIAEDLGFHPLESIMAVAASNGYVRIVRWLHGQGYKGNENDYISAVRGGQLEVVALLESY